MPFFNSKSDNYLGFLSLIQFAVENIYQIKSINEITSHFQTAIENITDERNEQIEQISPINKILSHQFIGQKNYIFQFQEGKNSFGEFSLDFLPTDSKEYLRNQIRSLAGKTETLPNNTERLANFRIQLFFDGILSYIQLKKKYKITRSYIIKKYGSPNQSPQAIETSRILQENHGQIIDCWYFEKNSTGYVITLYYFGGKFGTRSYVSFSVSEVY